jgi:AcrR family transcriptional regulator
MEHTAPTPRTDTRSRVQKVALELFAEQGYEKTSLREIAERLGVTKAALYYHFKSKEDIVHSFTDDYFAELDALLDWAKDQPRGEASRRELLDRYVGVVLASNEVFRFLEQNRASVQSMEAGKERFARVRVRLNALVDVLVGPGSPAARPGASHLPPCSPWARPACSSCRRWTTGTSSGPSSWRWPPT